jgi:hypothetical protein
MTSPARSRFSRPEGQIAGAYPERQALQKAMKLRMMGACHNPYVDEGELRSGSPLFSTMWWVSIQPSFDAWSELGLVRTERGGTIVGYRLGMVVGGCPEATARCDLRALDEPQFEAPQFLWPREGDGMILDGCRYRVTFSVSGADTTVDFAPVSNRFRTWERNFFSVARLLQTTTKNEALEEYLKVWEEYGH